MWATAFGVLSQALVNQSGDVITPRGNSCFGRKGGIEGQRALQWARGAASERRLIGSGAGIGALIGGIAGGGKGALIGGLSGAGPAQ